MAVFDIAFVGTSLTKGSGSANPGSGPVDGGSWIPKTQRALQAGKKSLVKTYNFGFPGQNSDYGLANTGLFAPLRAKAYVFEFCINDGATTQLLSLAQARQNLLGMANQILARTPDAKIALMTMNPAIGSAVSVRPNISDYHENYRTYAASQGWLLIDNALTWGGVTTTQIPDGVHPLLAEVESRLVPNIVSVLGPLIE